MSAMFLECERGHVRPRKRITLMAIIDFRHHRQCHRCRSLDRILERPTGGHYQALFVEGSQVLMIGLPLELLQLLGLLVSRDPFDLGASSSCGHQETLVLPKRVE